MANIEKTLTPQPSTVKSLLRTVLNSSWLYAAFTIAFLMFLSVLGSPVDLRCVRLAPREPVNCTKQTRLLGIIPLPEQKLAGVYGARVGKSVDEWEGDTGYRVELLTRGGIVPLRNTYISDFSGRDAKEDFAAKVNRFMDSSSPGTLVESEPGLLNFENIFCIVGWFLLMTAGGYVWGKIKPVFGTSSDS